MHIIWLSMETCGPWYLPILYSCFHNIEASRSSLGNDELASPVSARGIAPIIREVNSSQSAIGGRGKCRYFATKKGTSSVSKISSAQDSLSLLLRALIDYEWDEVPSILPFFLLFSFPVLLDIFPCIIQVLLAIWCTRRSNDKSTECVMGTPFDMYNYCRFEKYDNDPSTSLITDFL